MSAYNLSLDEAVILQDTNVTCSGADVTLILTNQNIIQVKRGYYGRNTSVQKFPLLSLKVLNGKPNVRVGKSINGETQLELYFQECEKAYVIKGLFSEKKWAGAIEKAYKAAAAEKKKTEKQIQKTGGGIFAPVKDSIGNAKNSIVSRAKGQGPKAIKCPECGAALVGNKGDQIKCGYCDALVTIK